MRNSLKFDIGMIGFGIAVLLWHRFGVEPYASHAKPHPAVTQQQPRQMSAVSGAAHAATASSWEITIPEGSPYQGLTPPAGQAVNPFLEVPRLVREMGRGKDYAGKDTEMRLLLERSKHQDYHFILQQQAANEMLRQELFHHYYQDPNNPHLLEALGFYTDQLLEARSEDAKLVYMCLRALKDHWPQSQIAAAARATFSRVQERASSSKADTATASGYYRQVYARELKKMSNRLGRDGLVDKPVDNLVYKPVDKDSNILSSTK